MDRFYLFVIISGLLAGTIVFGGGIFSGLGLSAYEISLLPAIGILLVLFPLILLKKDCRITLKQARFLLFFGVVAAVINITQYIPVVLGVPVAIVVLLLYTQPIWTLIFTKLFLKEEITPIKLLSAFLVLLGVVILVNPFSIDLKQNLAGIIVALVAGIALSGWIIIGSLASKQHIPIIATEFYNILFSGLILLLSLPLVRLFVPNKGITALSLSHPWYLLLAILGFGLISLLLTHLTYFEGVKKVPTVDAGIIMLLEPVVAAILSAIFLKQPITLYLLVGGAIILLANYLVIRAGNPQKNKNPLK